MQELKSIDRLYDLLPLVHRTRDAEQGYPLRALLQVINEQVNLVDADIKRLYDNWFIETCEEEIVPLIGELVGNSLGQSNQNQTQLNENGLRTNGLLSARQSVARLMKLRRRKGTLAVLEEIVADVGGWPSRVVEFRNLVSGNQSVKYPDQQKRSVDLRDNSALSLSTGRQIEPEIHSHLSPAEANHEALVSHGAFDQNQYSVDVRRINSRTSPGRFNLNNLGLFVFRLKSFHVKKSRACRGAKDHWFSFNPLGVDGPLFSKVQREEESFQVAGEENLPLPIRRNALLEAEKKKFVSRNFYGEQKSLAIFAEEWIGHPDEETPIPANQVIVADLSDWKAYEASEKTILIDPVLGRLVFHHRHYPKMGVLVSYHYGFPAKIGGGTYPRELSELEGSMVYRIGKSAGMDVDFCSITDACNAWMEERPERAIFEIYDNETYSGQLNFQLFENQALQIRSANGCRPVLDLVGAGTIVGEPGSRLKLDGLTIAGAPLKIEGGLSEILVRHSTLAPRVGASFVIANCNARVKILHSIVGTIQINQDEVACEPVNIEIADSIVDANGRDQEALGSSGMYSSEQPYAHARLAHACLNVLRSTIIGYVETFVLDLAQDSIFHGRVSVGNYQRGQMRFCYVDMTPQGDDCSKTPKRFRCQPDEAQKSNDAVGMRPVFSSLRYGSPNYCQLDDNCALEIKEGAEDQSEMGVYHDLYEPQRRAMTQDRLNKFTPSDSKTTLIFAT